MEKLPHCYRRDNFIEEDDEDQVIVPEGQQMFFLSQEHANMMAIFCCFNPKAQRPQ